MINKIISKLIRGVLLLEIHLRGPRIKYSARRAKILRRKYIQSRCPYPIYKPHRISGLLADSYRKASYLRNFKVAHTSIEKVFFENDSRREDYHQFAKKNNLAEIPIFMALGRTSQNHLFFPLNNIKTIASYRKGWRVRGGETIEDLKPKRITLDEVNSYFVFTFVRNPFSKFVSFSNNQFFRRNGKYYTKVETEPYNFWLHEVSSFSELAYKISKIADCHFEGHLFPQHLWIDNFQASGGKIDFIGKFETLRQDFEPLRNNALTFCLWNTTIKAQANMKIGAITTRPKQPRWSIKDIAKTSRAFSYEDEYPKLLDYLASLIRYLENK